MMDGSAGVTSVWFNTVTKAPNTSTANISHSLRDSFIFYLVCYSSLACASPYAFWGPTYCTTARPRVAANRAERLRGWQLARSPLGTLT